MMATKKTTKAGSTKMEGSNDRFSYPIGVKNLVLPKQQKKTGSKKKK